MKKSILEFEGGEGFSYEAFLSSKGVVKKPSDEEENFVEAIESEFEPSVSSADKKDYMMAAASGLLAAGIDILWVGEFSLERASIWGRTNIERFVVALAKTKGYKGDSLKGAIKKLEKAFPNPSDKLTAEFGGGLQHHLRDFAHHPTLLGLVFSILSQFTGYGFGTNTAGDFISEKLPEEVVVGQNFAEKVFNGTVVWAGHLVSDMAGSSGSVGSGTGIPGPLLSVFKEISSLPFVKELQGVDEKGNYELSKLISKLFNGTFFKEEGAKEGVRFDLRTELGVTYEIGRMAVPVIVNECIVRAVYSIRRFYQEVQAQDVRTLGDLGKIHPKKFLPLKSKSLARMNTVASGIFMAVECSAAAAGAALRSGGKMERFAKEFLLSVNYVGIGRFAIACKSDAKYIAKDFQDAYAAFEEKQRQKRAAELESNPGIQRLLLTKKQATILESLKWQKVLYDISKTSKKKDKLVKQQWKYEWLSERPMEPESERTLQALIEEEVERSERADWLRLVALELMLFEPYFQLGSATDKRFKGLKVVNWYETERFFAVQDVITSGEMKRLIKTYRKSVSALRGTKTKATIGVAATAAISVATAGVGWVLAPKVAILIMGETFAGLSGAALTSASLAAIGGGSLAAGGLGMAGGTAIIAGGGALLGAATSGAASLSATVALSSKDFALTECAKLLTFCQHVLTEAEDGVEAIRQVKIGIDKSIFELERVMEKGEAGEKSDKEMTKLIKEQKTSMKYMQKCSNQLEKLIEKLEL
ncbi:hypothetical protein [Pradoshia sp.]